MLINQSILSAIINNLFWKSGIQILSIIKHIIIAGYIGLSIQLDIFYMALTIIAVFITSWAIVFENIAIPKLVNLKKISNTEFENLCSCLLFFSFIISIIFCLLFIIVPNFFTSLALGFNIEKRIELSQGFIWLLPAILFYLPLSVLSSIFKSIRAFTIISIIELVATLSIILCIYNFFNDLNILFWSYSLGMIISFFLSYIILIKNFNKNINFLVNNNFQKLLTALVPLLIIHSTFYLFALTDRMFVSFLNVGDISAYAYATVIVFALPQLLGLANYFLTVYSEQINVKEKNKKFNDAISLSIFFGLPSSIFLVVIGIDFISMLLERGAFQASDTKRVYEVISPLSLIILPIIMQGALDQIYQAEQQFKRIILLKLCGLFINILLNYLFIFDFKLGVTGAAFATSLAYWFILLLSLYNLKYLLIIINWKKHFIWFSWILICLLPILVISKFNLIYSNLNFLNIIIYTIIMLLLIFLCCYLYKGGEKKLIVENLNKILRLNY